MGLIAWIDIETTGTDERQDPMLELGIILTSTSMGFTPIARKNFVIKPKNIAAAEQRMRNGNSDDPEFVWRMHQTNGLWEMCLAEGRPIGEVEEEVLAMIAQHNAQRGAKVTLGGSGVAQFDYRFILRQMPDLGAILTYYSQDVGCVRRMAKLCGVSAPAEASDGSLKNHRAIDDITMHLAEARWFTRLFEAAKRAGIVADLLAEDASL